MGDRNNGWDKFGPVVRERTKKLEDNRRKIVLDLVKFRWLVSDLTIGFSLAKEHLSERLTCERYSLSLCRIPLCDGKFENRVRNDKRSRYLISSGL